MEQLDEPADRVLAVYDRAIKVCPWRAEARHGASRYCRQKKDFVRGYYYARGGIPTQLPNDGLLLQPWIYVYGLRTEFAINAYHAGLHRECLEACLDVLSHPDTSDEARRLLGDMSRQSLTKMIDPAWGLNRSTYSSKYVPLWRI
ncbi:hypothetical protein ACRAWG_33605 [Methylobacterium sp. P31]